MSLKDRHLTPAKLFNKLRDRSANSATDRRFLDGIFRAMGYTAGFADASADLFSEVTIENGTMGNMGYGPQHNTMYARLDVGSAFDLMAFRIKAANGCDLHFMKTCGNHFFYCLN